jgi:hypothetical protein
MYLHIPAEYLAYSVMPPEDLDRIFSPRSKRRVEESESMHLTSQKKIRHQNKNEYCLIERQNATESSELVTHKKVEGLIFCLFPCIDKNKP